MDQVLNIKLPASFKPDKASQQALQMSVVQAHGDGWELRSVDITKGVARFVRTVNDADPAYQPDISDQRISVRLTGKEDFTSLAQWVASKYGKQYSLTSVDPVAKVAIFQVLSPEIDRCRNSLASLFGQKPWEITVSQRPGGGFVVSLPSDYRPSKYDRQLSEIAATVVGKPGWSFVGDSSSGQGEFIPGELPTFPPIIHFKDVPLSHSWSRIYLGEQLGTQESPSTKPLYTDFDTNPHILINGTTNSGKSVLVFALITGALIEGWDLVIIDPEKEGIDFESFRPWIAQGNLATTLTAAAITMERVVDEMGRRTNIIRNNHVRKWTELPEGTLTPMMVVIEEAASLLTLEPISKGLDKESEAYLVMTENNAMRGDIQHKMSLLLRKARFTGISLVIVSQTSRAASGLPPAMRELTSGRILTGPSPTKAQLETALKDPSSVPAVPSWIANDTEAARGVGVFEFDGYPPGVFKGVFINGEPELVSVLNKYRVPTRLDSLSSS
jgi:hypothetical protein